MMLERYGLCLCLWLLHCGVCAQRRGLQCSDADGRPQRCFPPFVNAGFLVQSVEATNTCGAHGRQEYCDMDGSFNRDCGRVCDETAGDVQVTGHSASLAVDGMPDTWWQSESLYDGNLSYPNTVNLTIHLGKSYVITYIEINFRQFAPESFAIYKRTHSDSQWIPYQYYSGNCETIYGVAANGVPASEMDATCSDQYSDIFAGLNARVVFSTLENRPGRRNHQDNMQIQEWITATDIRIVMSRLSTLGDEAFGETDVLRSYFYAISHIAIGGRCQCNGHAKNCSSSDKSGEGPICQCEHNTAGKDCDRCMPFFNEKPWTPATSANPNECLPCDCNGLADNCYFDMTLYNATGHGGHCENCRNNTDGPRCGKCRAGYCRDKVSGNCVLCKVSSGEYNSTLEVEEVKENGKRNGQVAARLHLGLLVTVLTSIGLLYKR